MDGVIDVAVDVRHGGRARTGTAVRDEHQLHRLVRALAARHRLAPLPGGVARVAQLIAQLERLRRRQLQRSCPKARTCIKTDTITTSSFFISIKLKLLNYETMPSSTS